MASPGNGEPWYIIDSVFTGIFKYFQVFSGIFKFFQVFSGIYRYFQIFSGIFRYFQVFTGTLLDIYLTIKIIRIKYPNSLVVNNVVFLIRTHTYLMQFQNATSCNPFK